MPKMYENGIYRDMTEEEVEQLNSDLGIVAASDPLTEMVTAMSTATTIAQMRSAAKAFLDKTEV